MDPDLISKCMRQAKEAHESLPAADRPSLDALFLAAYLSRPGAVKRYTLRQDPPQWFITKVRAMESHAATAANIIGRLGTQNPTPQQAKQCGIWLRSLGYVAHKSNGRTLFSIDNG